MTQTPEAPEAPEPEAEPVSPERVLDDDDADAEAAENETPAEPEPEQVDALKELKRIESEVKKEREAHAKRLNKILGDAATDVLPCPLCFHGLHGYVLPGDATLMEDEQRAAVLAFIGATEPSEYEMAEGVEMCPRCNGLGKLKYPTRVEHTELQLCPKCSGSGYVTIQPAAPEPAPSWTTSTGSNNIYQADGLACPICGQVGMLGKPHYCQPAQVPA